MCRSQAQGGRRCNGSGKGGSAGLGAADSSASSISWTDVPPESEATIRERRTETFNKMFPGPLSEAQRRTFTLRDAGYQGWINQDGYAVAGEPLMK